MSDATPPPLPKRPSWVLRIWSGLRLLAAILLCFFALFGVVRAPITPLFVAALLSTELGHWLILAPLLLAFLPRTQSWVGKLGTLIAAVSCLLFISSAFRAAAVAGRIQREIRAAFPGSDMAGEDSFRWRRLWLASPVLPLKPEPVVFAEPDGKPLRLLLYRSQLRTPAPCVVVIHGGGWRGGDADEAPVTSRRLAERGFAVAALEYRLAPESTWPAQREDVLAALQCLKDRAGEFGIDPQQFVLLGRSAGGQIAQAVAYGAHDPAIRGCISFYGPSDLHFAFRYARSDDILNSLKLIKDFMGGTPDEKKENYDTASSILMVEPRSPPTLLLHGARDEMVWFRYSERLEERLQELKGPHYFVRMPWATHSFDLNPNGPGGQISTYAVLTFLNAVTHPTGAR